MTDDLFDPKAHLVGTLESFTFENERGDFAVANVNTATGRIKVVGNLRQAVPGERLQLEGQWVDNPQFGRQFKASDVVVLPPTTRKGVIRYLSSGLIEGIGKVLAQRLVDTFGQHTLDIIDAEPQRLFEVPGIGKVRQQQIGEAWKKQRAIRQIMLFLAENSVSTTLAYRILQVYGSGALEMVRDHPYRLARDVHGIGFLSADRIARNQGLSTSDPTRIAAGLEWVLEEASGEGHVFLPRSLLCQRAAQILELDPGQVDAILETARAQGSLIEDPSIPLPSPAIYAPASYGAEVELTQRIRRLAAVQIPGVAREALLVRARAAVRNLGFKLEKGQQSAIETLIGRPFSLLTGGPGTGKTTLIRVFCEAVEAGGGTVLLAAPTGRAARRLGEAAGRPAETLHRLLAFDFAQRRFARNEKDPLKANLVIVDEVSMLDQFLARSLLRAISAETCLLLVGDADQLPSVGPGNVLSELLQVSPLPRTRLTEVFRQEEHSDIIENAHRIRQGLSLRKQHRAPRSLGEFYHIDAKSPSDAARQVLKLVCERIPAAFHFDPFDDIQVLSPMHRGDCGIDSLNTELQGLLNPSGEPVRLAEREFRIGDKVIQLRNDYQREVFNGQIGQLAGVDPETGAVTVQFESRLVSYDRGNLADLALAYCISIHKSQGSEYPAVVVPITGQHYVMLQRNLLYTAVTRARRLVCLVGEAHALRRALHNNAPVERYTGLAHRLRSADEPGLSLLPFPDEPA